MRHPITNLRALAESIWHMGWSWTLHEAFIWPAQARIDGWRWTWPIRTAWEKLTGTHWDGRT